MHKIRNGLLVPMAGLAILVSGICLSSALVRQRHLPMDIAPVSEPSVPLSLPDTAAPTSTGRDIITIRLGAEGSAEMVQQRRLTVLSQAGLRSTGWQRISYSGTFDTVEVIEAYTEKADGRVIPVGPAGMFVGQWNVPGVDIHDYRVRELVFPDLSVGDSVVYTVRKHSRPVIPGLYSTTLEPLKSIAQTVTITAPRAMPLRVAVLGKGFVHRVATDEATQTHTFSHPGLNPAASAGSSGPIDAAQQGARVLVSIQANYVEYGNAFWAHYRQKAQITPEIRALAQDITRGISDRHEQARAIDRWVKQNVRFMLIAVGTGGWAPDSAADVLSKRYGDCKGLSVLMSALLAAQGIASEFVLVSINDSYTLPPVAVGVFGHVFLYLPEFGHYADPAGPLSGFAVLAPFAYDKPVVRFGAGGASVARVPAMRPDDHTVTHRTRIEVAADGTVSGRTTELTAGIYANESRKFAAALAESGNAKSAAQELSSNDTLGRGRFAASPPATLAEPFALVGEFTLSAKVSSAPASEYPIPVGLTVRPRPAGLFGLGTSDGTAPFVCRAGRHVEDIEIAFAEGLRLPLVPQGVRVDTRWFSYRAEYRLENRTLKVKRVFTSIVGRQLCPATVEAEIETPMKQVADDLAQNLKFGAAVAAGSEPLSATTSE